MKRVVVSLNSVALAFLLLERVIGDTILGNVILIGLAAMLLFVAAIAGLVALIQKRTMGSVVSFSMSVALIVYIGARLYLDTVPAGYGP